MVWEPKPVWLSDPLHSNLFGSGRDPIHFDVTSKMASHSKWQTRAKDLISAVEFESFLDEIQQDKSIHQLKLLDIDIICRFGEWKFWKGEICRQTRRPLCRRVIIAVVEKWH